MSESRNFISLLRARWNENKFVCVGLDSEMARIPRVGALAGLGDEQACLQFNKAIVDATGRPRLHGGTAATVAGADRYLVMTAQRASELEKFKE